MGKSRRDAHLLITGYEVPGEQKQKDAARRDARKGKKEYELYTVILPHSVSDKE